MSNVTLGPTALRRGAAGGASSRSGMLSEALLVGNIMWMVMVAMQAVPMQMIAPLDVAAARHDEDVSVRMHHVNVGAVQPGQHRRGDDIGDRAEHRMPASEIKHAIE